MEITLNNQIKIIEEQCTIAQLLEPILGSKQNGIAIAVNKSVVPKTNWHNHLLNQNDAVLIIKATQGG